MTSPSILFADPESAVLEPGPPDCLPDLNLDQVFDSITAGREVYDLAPFFHTPLHSADAVAYRHAVLRDLENDELVESLTKFAEQIRRVRDHGAQMKKLHYSRQRQSWFLDAVSVYCTAVEALAGDLDKADLASAGFRGVRDYLTRYVAGTAFTSLRDETRGLQEELARIRYCVRIHGERVTVTDYHGESDYGADVHETFEKFQQGAVRSYLVKFSEYADMNHVEAQILDLVAKLNTEVFGHLGAYCEQHAGYFDATVRAFDREAQFYLGYLAYTRKLGEGGLAFCYPRIVDGSESTNVADGFDIAVADTLVPFHKPVVCNDIELTGPERVLLVTGPNHGGKTTFARAVGQVHYLASLGVLVPGREAQLRLPDAIYTLFEKEEDVSELVGKLQDDLYRIHDILDQATPDSMLVMNEIFTSTTLQDALLLGRNILARVLDRGMLAVFVTFVDELAALSNTIVSMVAAVDPADPAVRTYKLDRRPPDGLAYASAIAAKYRLTYSQLKDRIAS